MKPDSRDPNAMSAVYRPRRMKFGAFFAPLHSNRVNPTLALERDLELIEWMDKLTLRRGLDRRASFRRLRDASPRPEVFIATAAERTRNIRLGDRRGLAVLPPPAGAGRPDRPARPQTRGRLIFGVGPGS